MLQVSASHLLWKTHCRGQKETQPNSTVLYNQVPRILHQSVQNMCLHLDQRWSKWQDRSTSLWKLNMDENFSKWRDPDGVKCNLAVAANLVWFLKSKGCCALSWNCRHRVMLARPSIWHVSHQHADMTVMCHETCWRQQCHDFPKTTSEDIFPDMLALH